MPRAGKGRVEIRPRPTAPRDLAAQLTAMLKDGGPVPDAPWQGLEVLIPARDYPNRHASIMLSWLAALEAIDAVDAQDQSASG